MSPIELDEKNFLLKRTEEILQSSAGITMISATEREKKIAEFAANKAIECDEREVNLRTYIEANSCFL